MPNLDLVWPPPPAESASGSASGSALPSNPQPSVVNLPLPHPEAYPDEPREYARALMQRKDEIEKEIEVLNDVLKSHDVTQSTSLVDPEGYPRGDIDIYAIRHARALLVRLQNDRRSLNDLLAVALEEAFSRPAAGNSAQSVTSPIANGDSTSPQVNGDVRSHINGEREWPERAIARVNSVAPSSPSSRAGLMSGDLIYDFAGVTSSSAGGLQAIGALVNSSEGVSLELLVMRGNEKVTLRLIPRSGWGGRGLLGCHIVPA
ncbi:hypothetical protein IAU60_004147 [Kwoniella sp. DSM 27419]